MSHQPEKDELFAGAVASRSISWIFLQLPPFRCCTKLQFVTKVQFMCANPFITLRGVVVVLVDLSVGRRARTLRDAKNVASMSDRNRRRHSAVIMPIERAFLLRNSERYASRNYL
uniref:Secreted protein n=1 Tax=Steinernema glaseri TaxID=37863 RepID=A0A1I7ZAN8_9BILA